MGRAPLLLILLAVAGGALAWTALRDDSADDGSYLPDDLPPAEHGAATSNAAPGLAATGTAPRPMIRVRDTAADAARSARRATLRALWERALVLHGMQRNTQALALLEPFLESEKAFFEEAKHAKVLAAMRAAATKVLNVDAAEERLRELVAELRRWGNLRPLDPDDMTALENQLRHAAGVIAKLPKKQQRALLMRHLERFLLPRGRGARDDEVGTNHEYSLRAHMDIDALLDAVQAQEDVRDQPTVPLPIAEPETVEERRMKQLELLRVRGALTLLDSLHAGLAWLALGQGADGRLADSDALERCVALYADDEESLKVCRRHLDKRYDRYAISATSMALMAFLDFRDQDGRGLFEPTIARAVTWLRSQQDREGLFHKGARAYYTDAMALMALAQAAKATGDEGLKTAVGRGLAALHAARGPTGGYRYHARQVGDLSVSAWVAQAVEYATAAGIEVPEGMREDLVRYLRTVWIGGERFAYLGQTLGSHGRGQSSLYPAGMLTARILLEEIDKADLRAWTAWLLRGSGRRAPHLYTLYYGVRMDVWVNGKITTKWHDWLIDLARKQLVSGPVAGAFPRQVGAWIGRAGTILSTSFALLTMEHALFSR